MIVTYDINVGDTPIILMFELMIVMIIMMIKFFLDINEPPTSLTLSNLTIPEDSPIGTVVGTLSSNDPEKSYQTYTYSIVGPDRTPFALGGPGATTVVVNGTLDFEKTPVLDLVLRVIDSGGLFKEETFKINLIGKF
jgi:hypothetical protein